MKNSLKQKKVQSISKLRKRLIKVEKHKKNSGEQKQEVPNNNKGNSNIEIEVNDEYCKYIIGTGDHDDAGLKDDLVGTNIIDDKSEKDDDQEEENKEEILDPTSYQEEEENKEEILDPTSYQEEEENKQEILDPTYQEDTEDEYASSTKDFLPEIKKELEDAGLLSYLVSKTGGSMDLAGANENVRRTAIFLS
jgi:hypothetical protein